MTTWRVGCALNAIITEPDIYGCLEGVIVVRFNVKSVTSAVVRVLLEIRLRPYSLVCYCDSVT